MSCTMLCFSFALWKIKSSFDMDIFEIARRGKLPQTLIFQGNGKDMALELSKILKVPEYSPDFFFYSKENYTADGVRIFLKEAEQTGRRVFIFYEFDEMKPGVQNFLLKTFEEPKKDKYFFIITDNILKILSTIRSRAMIIPVERENKFKRIKKLISEGISDENAKLFSYLPEDFEFDEDFVSDWESLKKIFISHLEGDFGALTKIGDFFEAHKVEERIFIDLMIIFLRERGKVSEFDLIWNLEEVKEHIEMNVSARNAIIAKL